MLQSLRVLLRVSLAFVLFLVLTACSNGGSAGLNSFESPDGRYAFLYPTGWTRIAVNGGPQVVFHDLINSDETLSLVISDVDSYATLEELGTPSEVGQRLLKDVIASDGGRREVELIEAKSRESANHIFYDLEYKVHLDDRDRHEISTVVVDHGRLYTLATSTNELRWNKVESLFGKVITSFTFLI